MKELVGKVLNKIYVSNDQNWMKFDTSEGDMIYYAYADCCSETWFADILFDYRFDNKSVVSQVETIEVPDFVKKMANNDKRTRQEYDEVYGYKIIQENGSTVDIIFRNSSNGYYYGWCELVTKDSRWQADGVEELTWEVIESDWRA